MPGCTTVDSAATHPSTAGSIVTKNVLLSKHNWCFSLVLTKISSFFCCSHTAGAFELIAHPREASVSDKKQIVKCKEVKARSHRLFPSCAGIWKYWQTHKWTVWTKGRGLQAPSAYNCIGTKLTLPCFALLVGGASILSVKTLDFETACFAVLEFKPQPFSLLMTKIQYSPACPIPMGYRQCCPHSWQWYSMDKLGPAGCPCQLQITFSWGSHLGNATRSIHSPRSVPASFAGKLSKHGLSSSTDLCPWQLEDFFTPQQVNVMIFNFNSISLNPFPSSALSLSLFWQDKHLVNQ